MQTNGCSVLHQGCTTGSLWAMCGLQTVNLQPKGPGPSSTPPCSCCCCNQDLWFCSLLQLQHPRGRGGRRGQHSPQAQGCHGLWVCGVQKSHTACSSQPLRSWTGFPYLFCNGSHRNFSFLPLSPVADVQYGPSSSLSPPSLCFLPPIPKNKLQRATISSINILLLLFLLFHKHYSLNTYNLSKIGIM